MAKQTIGEQKKAKREEAFREKYPLHEIRIEPKVLDPKDVFDVPEDYFPVRIYRVDENTYQRRTHMKDFETKEQWEEFVHSRLSKKRLECFIAALPQHPVIERTDLQKLLAFVSMRVRSGANLPATDLEIAAVAGYNYAMNKIRAAALSHRRDSEPGGEQDQSWLLAACEPHSFPKLPASKSAKEIDED